MRRIDPSTPLGWVALAAGFLGLVAPNPSLADAIVDGRLNGVSDTALVGLDIDIPAELGTLAGDSLIHAFRQFGVATGGSATFHGPLDGSPVGRVVSVVTGCGAGCLDPTSIDGQLVLAPEIYSADFYFIDPNGVIFGENAHLDMGGGLIVSTADSVVLGNDGLLLASDPSSPASTLTSAAPSEFGFLDVPAPIELAGAQLEAPGGVALIGGNLRIDGTRSDGSFGILASEATRVDLASLASAGRVRIDADGVPGIEVVDATALGRIELTGGGVVSSSGLSPIAALGSGVPPRPASGAGDIFIRGGDFVIDEGARVQAFTATYSDGGNIDVELSGDLVIRSLDSGLFAGSGLVIDPEFEGTTSVRDIVPVDDGVFPFIEVERVFDGNPADIATNCVPGSCRVSYGGFGGFGDPSLARALGAAGDVRVRAANVLLLEGGEISNTSFFGGDAGEILIEAVGDITLQGAPGSFSSSFDEIRGGLFSNARRGGDAGEITISADTLSIDQFGAIVTELGSGDGSGGSVTVDVARLVVAGNSRIDTSTRDDGDAGAIEIRASQDVLLEGMLDDVEFSGITSLSHPEASGKAGRILLEAPWIHLRDGARISTQALGGADAGSIDLRFEEGLFLDHGAITAAAVGGFGGDVYLNGGPISVRPDGTLSVSPPPGLTIGKRLEIIDSEITTSVTSGLGSGGNVAIQSEQVILVRSRVTADADVSNGGNIQILAEQFAADDLSLVRAASNLGEDGVVEIVTPENVVIPSRADLPSRFLDASSLLRARCATRAGDTGPSTLAVLGPDGLPASPEDYLPVAIWLGGEIVAAPAGSTGARVDEVVLEGPGGDSHRWDVAWGCAKP